MKLSLKKEELLSYICKQINNTIPDGKIITNTILRPSFNLSLERLEFCFSKINLKYCRENNQVVFNHLYSDQYSTFLYFLSNSAYKNNLSKNVCEKIYCLNKYLNAIDIYFEVELPNIFLFVHPIGTVLGKAKYSDFLAVYQQCTVGSNKAKHPVIGKYVTLRPNSSILGNCKVSDNCELGAKSLLVDKNLNKNSLYTGNPRKFLIKKNKIFKKSFWV